MSRKNRTPSSSGIYHVMLRSVNQQIIFEEDADYQKFLFILSDCKEKHDIDIYAYCLMNNHIHLLVRADLEELAIFFRRFGSRFVHWYNAKYQRYGHLFQDRFHSKPVEDERYYLATLIYIHNNPVKAGICRVPSEYRWSSNNAFYGAKDPLINLDFSIQIATSIKELQRLFATSEDHFDLNDDADYEYAEAKSYVTDEDAIEMFKSLTGYSSTFDITSIPKATRDEIVRTLKDNNLSTKQISRLLGISIRTVNRIL